MKIYFIRLMVCVGLIGFLLSPALAQDVNLRQEADSLFEAKAFKQAADLYKKLLKQPSEKDHAYEHLVASYDRMAEQLLSNDETTKEQFQAAAVYFDKGIKIQKKYGEGIPESEILSEQARNYTRIGRGLMDIREFQPAGRFLKKAIAICDKNDIVYPTTFMNERLAGCYIELGNFAAAKKYVYKIYEPQNLETIADSLYCKEGEYALAAKVYMLIKHDADLEKAKGCDLQIARCYWFLRDVQRAIDWYSRIITPEDVNSLEGDIVIRSRTDECLDLQAGQHIADDNEPTKLDILRFAQALLNGRGKYAEARSFFDNISVVLANDDITKEYKAIRNTYYVKKLGGYINTPNHEFSPAFHAKDSSIIFVSDRDPNNEKKDKVNNEVRKVSDLYKVKLMEEDFGGMFVWTDEYIRETKSTYSPGGSDPERAGNNLNLAPADSVAGVPERFFAIERELQYNEGPMTFYPNDPHKLIFTGNAYDSLKYLKKSAPGEKYKLNTLRLFLAEWNEADSAWQTSPLRFSGENSDILNSPKYNTGHPSFNKKGDKLYFSSDAPVPGSMGNSDIYVAQWDEGSKTWKNPINLDQPINSNGNEVFPFLHTNNTGSESLYFSSNRSGSMGGLDIYKSFKLRGSFTEPLNLADTVNMAYSLNSKKDDFGLILNENETYGFFTSDRDSAIIDGKYTNNDNIYKFKIAKLEVFVCDKRTGEPLVDASIMLHSDVNSTYYKDEPFYEAKPTNQYGKNLFLNFRLNEDFKIVAEAEGYLPDSVFTNTYIEKIPKDGIIRAMICLEKRPKAELIVLANIKSEQQIFVTFDSEPFSLGEGIGQGELYELFYQDGINFLAEIKPSGSNLFINLNSPFEVDSMENPERIKRLKDLLYDKKIDVEKVTIIRNIRYNFAVPDPRFPNRPVFENKLVKPETELAKITEIMKRFPDLDLKMSSHTDACPLNNENHRIYDNLALSNRRNAKATSFLLENDLKPSRIKRCAYEYEYPVDLESTYDNCKNDYNRRTEFKFVYRGRDGYVMDCNCSDSMLHYIKPSTAEAKGNKK
ncbi:hypothetical protein R9C00_20025 [Flammeovirgaceae bacterium SG7u.111]|nr:hypothetical protein [Flammeovirgaceae bacterium SG7u.132]WPO33989.1 hypothetical protein R9C00_20025 [Flammeovirgaceae bacterium SG7u.111]